MKVENLIKQLQMLDPKADIYIHTNLEIYEPHIQIRHDNELNDDYFILSID